MSNEFLVDDLRLAIRDRNVVVVAGAGISITSSGSRPDGIASWTGLLRDGIARCKQAAHDLPDDWEQRVLGDLSSPLDSDLLAAAEKVSNTLQGQGGAFARWLQDTVGTIHCVNPGIIESLVALQAQIATTNYDSLFEEVTTWPPVTWLDKEGVERWIRGEEKSVLHLHGSWRESKSVVLGIRSYDAIVGDEQIQIGLRSLWTTKRFLFVGFGKGLSDPNFGALLDWASRVFPKSLYPHFRLTRSSEVAEIAQQHGRHGVAVLSYGERYEDLLPFLRSLAPGMAVKAVDSDEQPPKVGAQSSTLNSGTIRDTVSSGDLETNRNAKRPIAPEEVERQIFGLDDTQVTRKLKGQFRGIAYDSLIDTFYITGDHQSTARLVIPQHSTTIYQGSKGVLKLQEFDLPEKAKQVRSVSFANDLRKDYYTAEGWIFLCTASGFEQLFPTSIPSQSGYRLPKLPVGSRLVIVTFYEHAEAFFNGTEQIWIEVNDLCGKITNCNVMFGGLVQFVEFKTIYFFGHEVPLQFFGFSREDVNPLPATKADVTQRFGSLFGSLRGTSAVKRAKVDQFDWSIALQTWEELCDGNGHEWSGMKLNDVSGDLVITAVGQCRVSKKKKH